MKRYKQLGQVWTPREIVDFILDKITLFDNMKILEIVLSNWKLTTYKNFNEIIGFTEEFKGAKPYYQGSKINSFRIVG